MTFASFLSILFDVWTQFFGSTFFRVFGLGFFGFFCLIMCIKVVWYIVRSHRADY